MTDPLTISDARSAVLARVRPLPSASVPVAEAAGRVCAREAEAAVDLPPYAASAMDGYAVRSCDAPGPLLVVARIAAGRPADAPLGAGEAMGIATGGVVPGGADAVVPVEDVVEHDNMVTVPPDVAAGAHVRPRGGDLRAGSIVVASGTRLRPAHVGALAAAGVAEVAVARRPRAAVLSTGTELRTPGEALEPGQVYEANAPLLAAALRAAGADAEVLPAVADAEAEHRAALERALGADLVVTTGGVSVGPHDLVRRVAADLGVEEVFWRVAVKPGKPVAFGVRGGTLVFGLPGNPVSALVCFELFVRPAVLALQGAAEPGPDYRLARLARGVRRDPRRDQFVRASLSAGALEPLAGQESHMIARAAAADALVHVPLGDGELPAGAEARYIPLV